MAAVEVAVVRLLAIGKRRSWVVLAGVVMGVSTGCATTTDPPGAVAPTASVAAPAPEATIAAAGVLAPSRTEGVGLAASPSPPATATQVPSVTLAPPPPSAAATLGVAAEGGIAEYGTSGRREIALTFDAGADRGNAAAILDYLQTEGIPASFGILGQWAEVNPDLVGRMVAEGHMLFNHSWSHASFTGATTQTPPLSSEERREELRRTEGIVRELTGYELRPYFRPPYGDYDASVLADIASAGYPVALLWSCDSRDSLGASVDEILANCIDTARPGRIVLLHVGAQSAAYEALPRMIVALREQGFAFVTADEILQP